MNRRSCDQGGAWHEDRDRRQRRLRSVYGALLADAGNELWLFDKWPEHVLAMRTRGLRCEGASGDRTVLLNATTDAAEAGVCELAVVATKVMDIEAALGGARARVRPSALRSRAGRLERANRLGLRLAFVRVEARSDPRPPALAEVVDRVRQDWSHDQRRQLNEAVFERLLARYEVVIEGEAQNPLWGNLKAGAVEEQP
jgi:hypothetical protein